MSLATVAPAVDVAAPAHASEADDVDPFAALDPSLHALADQNRLNTFARHILHDASAPVSGAHGGSAGVGVGEGEGEDAFLSGLHDQDGTLFSAAGEPRFGELLDAARGDGSGGGDGGAGADGDLAMFENEERRKDDGDEAGAGDDLDGDENAEDVRLGRIVGRKRRRTDNEAIVVGPVENGDPIDPIKLKKDSHKEVERRRRENINDGINELAKLVPRTQYDGKMGKGVMIRHAAEYLQSIMLRNEELEKQVEALTNDKAAATLQLQEAQQQLQEEHVRALRFEDSWQKAEDRAATAQFEVDRLRAEVEMAKK
ncbi:basic helix-loop-helix protein [Cryptotrichosporon argae]